MRALLVCAASQLLCGSSNAPIHELWSAGITNSASPFTNFIATSGCVDADGNLFIGGSLTLEWPAEMAGFVEKYDPAGAHLWTRKFGTSAYDGIDCMASDSSGNVVILVREWEFPPPLLKIIKLAPDGTELWRAGETNVVAGTPRSTFSAVRLDAADNILVLGLRSIPASTNDGRLELFVSIFCGFDSSSIVG